LTKLGQCHSKLSSQSIESASVHFNTPYRDHTCSNTSELVCIHTSHLLAQLAAQCRTPVCPGLLVHLPDRAMQQHWSTLGKCNVPKSGARLPAMQAFRTRASSGTGRRCEPHFFELDPRLSRPSAAERESMSAAAR